MAETLVGIRAEGRQALVIAGMGHLIYKAGILESVEKRGRFNQRYIQPYPLDPEDARSPEEMLKSLLSAGSQEIELAHYFWIFSR